MQWWVQSEAEVSRAEDLYLSFVQKATFHQKYIHPGKARGIITIQGHGQARALNEGVEQDQGREAWPVWLSPMGWTERPGRLQLVHEPVRNAASYNKRVWLYLNA